MLASSSSSSSSSLRLCRRVVTMNILFSRLMSVKMPKMPRRIEHDDMWHDIQLLRGTSTGPMFEFGIHGVRMLALDRPKQLNALTLDMIRYITPRLKGWENTKDVNCVIVRGAGNKAFCAGGDVVALYNAGKKGGDTHSFFREEYTLNHLISTLNVPYVAVMDGITMGGGVGISVHGRYRVATENTMFAMPETGIGFFPDVGGSYFLPRLDGELGMYLGLTGHRLKGYDVFKAGIATHYVKSERVRRMCDLLCGVTAGSEPVDIAMTMSHQASTEGNEDVENHQFSLEPHLGAIDECFSGDSVEEIVEALKAHGTKWSDDTLKVLNRVSPTALKVTFRQLREGRTKTLEECFQMEFRIVQRFMRPKSDFFEGVRGLLVDGDKKFNWKPSSLNQVTADMVDEYFRPFDKPSHELLLGHLSEPPKKDIMDPDYEEDD